MIAVCSEHNTKYVSARCRQKCSLFNVTTGGIVHDHSALEWSQSNVWRRMYVCMYGVVRNLEMFFPRIMVSFFFQSGSQMSFSTTFEILVPVDDFLDP